MTSNKEIEKFCIEYLKTKDFEDYCHNGLQIEGKREVRKIVTGVTYSQDFIKKAIEKNADMMIVHHGLFMSALGRVPRISGHLKERLKLTLENNLNLMGFHLPLDAQEEIGNNISICKKLSIKNTQRVSVGFVGDLEEAIGFSDFVDLLDEKLKTNSYTIAAGPELVKRVGVVSGGSSPDFALAKDLGADTYITGDLRENIVREVEEEEINFINAGHYNSEKLGVQNLGEVLAKKFDLELEFIDIANEI